MKRTQHGVAAITAVLIVAVAASAATFMLAQQSALLDQALLVASRAQADAFAEAGLDWARGVLAQDARASEVDSLDEGWARPIAALPVERAVVSGAIADEQGKLNLNNLVRGNHASDEDVRAFRRLLESLALAPELADAVVDWIDADDALSGPGGAENAAYLSLARPYRAANAPLSQVEELYRVRGFDAATVAKLRPHVAALTPRVPGERTAINVNTATPAVLAAATALPPARVAELVARRRAKPFASAADFTALAAAPGKPLPGVALDVKSAWFSARVQVAQDDVQVATEALLRREPGAQGGTAIIWRRPRY